MSGLTIGQLTLNPAFDADVYEYSVTTTNATNKVTATGDGTITVTLNGTEMENATSATWESGENTLEITVAQDGKTPKTYTVTVTKS